MARLRPGSVIFVDKGKSPGRAVVLSTANRSGGVKITVLTAKRATLNLSSRDFHEPPRLLGQIELPEPFAPTQPDFQKIVVTRLHQAKEVASEWRSPEPGRQAVHPVEDDPELRDRLKAAAQADRVSRDVDQLR